MMLKWKGDRADESRIMILALLCIVLLVAPIVVCSETFFDAFNAAWGTTASSAVIGDKLVIYFDNVQLEEAKGRKVYRN